MIRSKNSNLDDALNQQANQVLGGSSASTGAAPAAGHQIGHVAYGNMPQNRCYVIGARVTSLATGTDITSTFFVYGTDAFSASARLQERLHGLGQMIVTANHPKLVNDEGQDLPSPSSSGSRLEF